MSQPPLTYQQQNTPPQDAQEDAQDAQRLADGLVELRAMLAAAGRRADRLAHDLPQAESLLQEYEDLRHRLEDTRTRIAAFHDRIHPPTQDEADVVEKA